MSAIAAFPLHKAIFQILELRGHPSRSIKRYFESGSQESPMPGKIEAIFQIRKSKVTYAAEKKSDGGAA